MNEDNKYYTPELEEFYYGFKCEIRIGDEWFQMDCRHIPHGRKTLEGLFRVKYIDKQDIESLGWKPTVYKNVECFELKPDIIRTFILFHFESSKSILSIDAKLSDTKSEQIFRGTIKNKSELIKLMKQLGIKLVNE